MHKTDPKQCTRPTPSHSPSPPTLFLACYICDLCALHTKDCALKTFASHTKVVTSALSILRSVPGTYDIANHPFLCLTLQKNNTAKDNEPWTCILFTQKQWAQFYVVVWAVLGSFIRHASIALVHLQALLGLIAPTRFYRTLGKSLNNQSVRQQWFGRSFSKSRFRTTIISIGMIFLIDLAIALPLFDETQNKTSVCMFSGFLGRSKCCLVELEIKRHRLHFKKAWCAQDRICETHIFLNRWVVLFNQIDDSLSPRTSSPLGLSRFKTDLFFPRV